MKWEVVFVKTNNEAVEAIANFLVEFGAGGVEIVDPKFLIETIKSEKMEEYYSEEILPEDLENTVVKAYYSSLDENKIKEGLNDISKIFGGRSFEISFYTVDDNEWKDNWKKYFKPFNIGEKVTICPSWMETDSKNRVVIKIDPQMAFGTGEHETTNMCVHLLQKENLIDKKLLDAGTGSGILSIIAKKLGAKVTAFDIDSVAVKVAKENLMQNEINDVSVIHGEINNINEDNFDIIVSNIIASVLIELRSEFKKRLKNNGVIILSGIIKSKEKKVIEEYKKEGFVLTNRLEMKEWVCLKFNA